MKFYLFDKTLSCPVFVPTKPFSLTNPDTLSKVAVNKARYYAVLERRIDKGRRSISLSCLANLMPRRSFYGAFFHFTPFMLNVCKRLITHKSTCLAKKLQQAEVDVAGALKIGWNYIITNVPINNVFNTYFGCNKILWQNPLWKKKFNLTRCFKTP